MKDLPTVPGKGLVSPESTRQRHEYLRNLGFDLRDLAHTNLTFDQISHNIEGFIGSVEIPVGLVGPLVMREKDSQELVHIPIATLEGALVASINRGAKAVSQSGGFHAVVLHQKMVRSPMFLFSCLDDALLCIRWVQAHFGEIKKVAESYSNHATLQGISSSLIGRSAHLKFVYTTGDASGQNMTTICTWQAVLWIREHFAKETGCIPEFFVLEGNGASDKKASYFSVIQGRGTHVVAECMLKEEDIRQVLRTNSTDMLRCFAQSQKINSMDGMFGNNVNVANALAGIFLATGQDMASLFESGFGILNLEPTDYGLYCSLNLPNLVVGTVGGGTGLLKQSNALQLMKCKGAGGAERFAKLIAGAALSLELSTMAAMVGGHFAKAHEKMGRNKPVQWLTKAEITADFLRPALLDCTLAKEMESIHLSDAQLIENGILISLTQKVNRKLTGFQPIQLIFNSTRPELTVLLKSKPLDSEVSQGLHLMAASINPDLADLFSKYEDKIEYAQCHLKEIQLYQWLHKLQYPYFPHFYGAFTDEKREIYILITELLDYGDLEVMHSENNIAVWTPDRIKSAIYAVHLAHEKLKTLPSEEQRRIRPFEVADALELYDKLADLCMDEYQHSPALAAKMSLLKSYVRELGDSSFSSAHNVEKTVIHNDFNPRNMAIRKSGEICIYDWELAVVDFPERDIVEFLSFVLPTDFDEAVLIDYVAYYYSLNPNIQTATRFDLLAYAAKSYLISRVSFYLVGKILMNYEFADRIFVNSIQMIELFDRKKT